ncbi:MAG: hypothetical protein ABI969_19125, partial [bacterium]
MTTQGTPDPVQDYASRAASADETAMQADWRARRLSWSRLGAALVVSLAFTYSARGGAASLAWSVGALGAAAFSVFVMLHRRAATAATRARAIAAACRAGIARCTRDWQNVPAPRLLMSP